MKEENNYTSSATLIIVGDDLIPHAITELLGLKPDQSWTNGDVDVLPSGRQHTYDFGGWKLFQDKIVEEFPLEDQLEHWIKRLSTKSGSFQTIENMGHSIELNCFITGSHPIGLNLDRELMSQLAALGLNLTFEWYYYDKSDHCSSEPK